MVMIVLSYFMRGRENRFFRAKRKIFSSIPQIDTLFRIHYNGSQGKTQG